MDNRYLSRPMLACFDGEAGPAPAPVPNPPNPPASAPEGFVSQQKLNEILANEPGSNAAGGIEESASMTSTVRRPCSVSTPAASVAPVLSSAIRPSFMAT